MNAPTPLATYQAMAKRALKRQYPTAQSTISELETTLCGASMVQIGTACVEVEYSIEPGCKEEPATMGDPGSPGSEPSAEIHKIVLTSDMEFVDAGDEAKAITLHAGFDITDFFPRTAHWDGKIGEIEDEILSGQYDAEYSAHLDALIDRAEARKEATFE